MITGWVIPFLILFGLALGSFLNAYVWRFPREERISDKHSVCVHCRHTLAAADLVPLFSFLVLRGRCRYCRKPIPWHYPVVELATALVVLLPLAVFGFTAAFAVTAVLGVFLELLFLLDLRYSLLPDSVTLPAIGVAVLVSLLLGRSFSAVVVGAILGAGFFALQYVVSRGAWIGGGDVRLGAVMGAALGWQGLALALIISYWSGAIVGVMLIAGRRKKWKSRIPFGTFLAAATYVVLLAMPTADFWINSSRFLFP